MTVAGCNVNIIFVCCINGFKCRKGARQVETVLEPRNSKFLVRLGLHRVSTWQIVISVHSNGVIAVEVLLPLPLMVLSVSVIRTGLTKLKDVQLHILLAGVAIHLGKMMTNSSLVIFLKWSVNWSRQSLLVSPT